VSDRKILSALLAAGVGLAAAAAVARAATPASRIEADAVGFVVPNVYAKGIPLAFSGLDGAENASTALVGITREEPLTVQFQAPKEPVLRLYLPPHADEGLRYRAVTNDFLVATIPSDPITVVLGFASSNVVVGRVPPGGRVSLQGGDMNCMIMRKDVGDRMQFAFAWDPRGGKLAAEAAAAALNTSIDTLVEQRLEFFKKAAAAPESASPLAARTLAKAFSAMKLSVVSPEGRFKSRWVMPARPLGAATLRESALESIGLTYLDGAVAKDAVMVFCLAQGTDGLVPGSMSVAAQADTTDVPVLAWAGLRAYQRTGQRDRDFLQRLYDAASKHVKWYVNNRMVGENSALFSVKPPAEAGAALSLPLSCYLANECGYLQQMAQILGFREDAKTWGDRADSIAEAARKQFWNEEKGFFFGRDKVGGEPIPAWTAEGFFPLWSGIATKDQAAALVKHLADPAKFGGPVPVPLVARDAPLPKAEAALWRMHPQINYFVIAGLQRYGYAKEAEEVRQKTLAAVAKWYGRTGCLFESYDSADEVSPEQLESSRSGGAAEPAQLPRDVSSTAALFVDLLFRPKL